MDAHVPKRSFPSLNARSCPPTMFCHAPLLYRFLFRSRTHSLAPERSSTSGFEILVARRSSSASLKPRTAPHRKHTKPRYPTIWSISFHARIVRSILIHFVKPRHACIRDFAGFLRRLPCVANRCCGQLSRSSCMIQIAKKFWRERTTSPSPVREARSSAHGKSVARRREARGTSPSAFCSQELMHLVNKVWLPRGGSIAVPKFDQQKIPGRDGRWSHAGEGQAQGSHGLHEGA